MLRYIIGYKCSVDNITTPQKPPRNQSIVSVISIRLSFTRSIFTLPNKPKNCCIPIAPTKGGIIIGIRIIARNVSRPGYRNRVKKYASGRLTTLVIAVTIIPILKLLITSSRIFGSVTINLKYVRLNLFSIQNASLKT